MSLSIVSRGLTATVLMIAASAIPAATARAATGPVPAPSTSMIPVAVPAATGPVSAASTASALPAKTAGRYSEVPGNPHNAPTWTFADPRDESHRGPNLVDHRGVMVSCRVRGAAVADGDVWWYRIAQSPWNGRDYASADDFYNDGRSSGSLKGTPYYDPRVPVCR